MNHKLLRRSLVAPFAAAAALALTLGAAPAAFADTSAPVDTSTPSVAFTFPDPAYESYAGVAVDVANVPAGASVSISVTCALPTPASYTLLSFGATSGVAHFVNDLPKSLNGKTCVATGVTSNANQTIRFSPGSTLTTDKEVPITTLRATLVTTSRTGGL